MRKKTIRSLKSLKPVNIVYFLMIFIALSTIGSFPSPGINYSDIYREVIAETGFVGLLLYWVYSNYNTPQKELTISATRLWFGALFIFATLSVFWAVNIDFFVSKYLLWVAAAAVFLLALNVKINTKTFINIARALIFIAVYISIIGIIQKLFSIDIFDQASAPAANLVNKNMAAQIIVLVFPLTLFLLITDKNKRLLPFYPFAIALILTYIFYTSTRAAWLSISLEILFILITLIFYKGKLKQALAKKIFYWNKKQTIMAIIAFTLFILFINISHNGFESFIGVATEKINAVVDNVQNKENVRYRSFQASLSMIINNPILGTGMGSFYYNGLTLTADLPTSINGLLRAHNDIFELGVELGVTGIIFFIGAVVSLFIILIRLMCQQNVKRQLFYCMLTAALSGSFLNMQFSFPYQMPVPLMLLALYSALIIKSGDDFESTKTKSIVISLQNWHIGTGFISVVFVGVVLVNITWLNVFANINDNIKYGRWQDPIASNLLVCHRLTTKILSSITKVHFYNKSNKSINDHKAALLPLDSFNNCVENTWFYYHVLASTNKNLRNYKKASEFFKKAKDIHPAGTYLDYILLFNAYRNLRDNKAAATLYQELKNELANTEISVPQKKILRYLTLMALNLKKTKEAIKYYEEHLKLYGEDNLLSLYIQRST